MSTLLDSIKSYITPELIVQASNQLGESEIGVGKAISGLAPTILAGLLNKTGDSGAMGRIFNLIANFNPGVLDNPGDLIGGGNLAHNDPKDVSGQLLGTVFGSKVPAITNAVSSFAGTKASSTSSLLGLTGPLVMGLLSQKINSDGLNVSGFANLLVSQKNSILGALPTGLGAVIGLPDAGSTPAASASTADAPATGSSWLWPLLLLLGLGGAIMYYMKNCTAKPEPPKAEMPAPAAEPAPPPPPARFTLKLPTGYEVMGEPAGIEADLLQFIQTADSLPGKNNWFDFDHLLFQTASDQLDMEQSRTQLVNVFEILKAYPKVKIKIGGYTDNAGDAKQNKSLSDRRAKNVMAELVKMGIEKNRLEAEGYGQEHPVASNETEEGRAKNRRVSVSVRAK